MMKKNIFKIGVLGGLLMPVITLAALDGLKGLLTGFGELLNLIIPVIFGLSMIYFFWGVAQFILHDAGNEKTREEGKKKIIWSIVALFVFVSIYGILRFIGELVDIPLNSSTNSLNSDYLYPTPSNFNDTP